MILPIVAYGMPVLKRKAEPVELNDELRRLIDDMFETMYRAEGVGLAAPQIDKSIRLFVIDPAPFARWEELSPEEREQLRNAKMAFINPQLVEESGEEWSFEEGCLSIPGINEKVKRPERITLRYTDVEGKEHEQTFEGLLARVIQHEYDHIEGILFTDRLSPLKRKLLAKKLEKISKGQVQVSYKMKFPKR